MRMRINKLTSYGGVASYLRGCVYGICGGRMAERRLRALQNDRQLARFVLEGRATGKQLGTGSYGSVEEVKGRNTSREKWRIIFNTDLGAPDDQQIIYSPYNLWPHQQIH